MKTQQAFMTKTVQAPASQSGILQRQSACGNHTMSGVCQECSTKRQFGLQTKLTVSEPGDVYEQEADRIAAQVSSAPTHPLVNGAPPHLQCFAGQLTGQVDAAPASVGQALASPGRPLEPELRQDMEQRFGHDFSRVRVHSGAAAEQSARDVHAHAYTVGHNVVFGAGRFAPGAQDGRRLLAHELTHVVQQSGANGMSVGQSNDKRSLSPLSSISSVVQRQPDDKGSTDPGSPRSEYEEEPEVIRYAVGARELGKLADGTILYSSKSLTATGISDSAFYVGPFMSDMGNFFYVYRFTSSDEKKGTYGFARATYLPGSGDPKSAKELRAKLAGVTGGKAVEFKTTGLIPPEGGAAVTKETEGAAPKDTAKTGTSPSKSPSKTETSEPTELTPHRKKWLKAGRDDMKHEILSLFNSIQKLKDKRISVWAKNAEIEDPKPLRTALEVAVAIVGYGMGGVIAGFLTKKLAGIIISHYAKEFTEEALHKATDKLVNAIFHHAIAPAKQFLSEATRKAVEEDQQTNAKSALASKGSLLDCYVEAVGLQTISEERVQAREFNAEVDAKHSDLVLADLVATFEQLYKTLMGDPGMFLRELTIGLVKLKDEVYLEKRAEKYGGDRARLLKEDPTIDETETRSGNLRILGPVGGIGSLREWWKPDFSSDLRGQASGINRAVLRELTGATPQDMPLTLAFRFWALNPFSGLFQDVFCKVWFTRRPNGDISVDLDESGSGSSVEDGLEWLASYYLQSGREFSTKERNENVAKGARKLYEQIKEKPVKNWDTTDIF